MARHAIAASALCMLTACDPIYGARTTALPRLEAGRDGGRAAALAMVGRIAERHDLRQSADGVNPEGWAPCYRRDVLEVCGRMRADTIEVGYWQLPQYLKQTDALRHEVADSLRALLGPAQVRECGWRNGFRPGEVRCSIRSVANGG